MKQVLLRICQLQPQYSHKNTPPMQERGQLIRHTLRSEIEKLAPVIIPNLGSYGADFIVDASDGIGNKVATPWVRYGSKKMSPSAQEGYYAVVHFKTDGSGLYLTLGCASTKGKSIIPLKAEDLKERTSKAIEVIIEKHGGIGSFSDEINLGAKTDVSKSFEKATVAAKFIHRDELFDIDLEDLFTELSAYLKTVYDAQTSGFDITPSDQDEEVIEALLNPHKKRKGIQGFVQSADERKAIEMRAMVVTDEWFKSQGYTTADKSLKESYDILATRGEEVIYVEVKGTTSYEPTSIIMTSNEVELHKSKKGETALAIVSSIKLQKADPPVATGGDLEVEIGWDIDAWTLNPSQYKVIRPPKN